MHQLRPEALAHRGGDGRFRQFPKLEMNGIRILRARRAHRRQQIPIHMGSRQPARHASAAAGSARAPAVPTIQPQDAAVFLPVGRVYTFSMTKCECEASTYTGLALRRSSSAS